jgi:hypothetical protein
MTVVSLLYCTVVVNGRLRCLGSAQHLKHRYGNGFEVNIKILSPTDENLLAAFKTLRDSNAVPAFASTMNPMNGGRSTSGKFFSFSPHYLSLTS